MSCFASRVLLLLLLLSGCDKRCNLEDCRTLYKKCRAVLPAEPNYGHCGLGRDDLDDETIIRDYDDDRDFRCAQACVASNSGEVLECVSGASGACISASTGSGVLAQCLSQRPPADAGCTAKCGEARETCEKACKPGVPRACLDCVSKCGLAWGRCDAACRKDDAP